MNQPEFKFSSLTAAIFLSILPILIGIIFSVLLAMKIGYKRLIFIASTMYSVGILISIIINNFLFFCIFYIGVSTSGYAIGAMPIYVCIWSHFINEKGKVTGVLIFFQGIGTLVFSLIALALINPENKEGTIKYSEGSQELNFFDEEIASRVRISLIILALIYGIFNISGSLLISHNTENPMV